MNISGAEALQLWLPVQTGPEPQVEVFSSVLGFMLLADIAIYKTQSLCGEENPRMAMQ